MSVRELRRDSPSGWFSKSWGLSASVSFLSSPPLLALLLAPFFALSLSLVPRFLFLNCTETLAMQATFHVNEGLHGWHNFLCIDPRHTRFDGNVPAGPNGIIGL